jgi:hypothetical protein
MNTLASLIRLTEETPLGELFRGKRGKRGEKGDKGARGPQGKGLHMADWFIDGVSIPGSTGDGVIDFSGASGTIAEGALITAGDTSDYNVSGPTFTFKPGKYLVTLSFAYNFEDGPSGSTGGYTGPYPVTFEGFLFTPNNPFYYTVFGPPTSESTFAQTITVQQLVSFNTVTTGEIIVDADSTGSPYLSVAFVNLSINKIS